MATSRNDRLLTTALKQRLDRRRLLHTSGAAGLALGTGLRFGSQAGAQEITFSRDYDGTTLNLLMEDLLETTIIEEMLPEFKELTGITVNFEKVEYGVMHEKLVPQLAAGPGMAPTTCSRSTSTGSMSSPARAGSKISVNVSPTVAAPSPSIATSR